MLTDIWTVFWRDWVVLKHRMTAFILSRMVAPLLYLVAFGWGLGRSIQTANGASYIDFLVPGILALNSMNISFNSVTPVHAERVYHKSIEEYIIAPIRPYAYITGKVLAAVLRGLISSAIIIILAIALFLGSYRDNRIVENVFKGIRPAVIALILTPTIRLASKAGLNKWTWWVPVVTALLIWWLGVSPVWIIFATIVGAILYYIFKLRKA